MSRSISHIALVVRDPARTAALFERLFGTKPRLLASRKNGPPETFIRLGGVWFTLVKGEPPAVRRDDHVAFSVNAEELPELVARLSELGLEHQMARTGTAAQSLYFFDHDNHLFELHVGQLEQELGSDVEP